MTTSQTELTLGSPARDLTLTFTDGAGVELSSLWPERPLALIFFEELDGRFVVDRAIQWRDSDNIVRAAGGEIVAICAATPAEAETFSTTWALPYALLCDDDGDAYARYGVTTECPGRFAIDTEGAIRYIHRNDGTLDNPSSWDLIDAISAVTGKHVERAPLTPLGDDSADEDSHDAPVAGQHALNGYVCAKCGHSDYEVTDVSATSGMMSRMVNLQNRRFSAVSCMRCKFTEFYKTNSSALRNVFDVVVGA